MNKFTNKPSEQTANLNNVKHYNVVGNGQGNSGYNSTNNYTTTINSNGIKQDVQLNEKTEFSSKTLDKIKQKKMNKDSKKLASDNIDYEPVFK
jgi:hypothetical protein